MPIELPRGLPFSVDTWTPASLRKRHHFLTHAHKDHLTGIVAHSARPIYATRLTKTLALCFFPLLDDSVFVEIEIGETVVIDDPDGAFSVTAFDANHCPGAVMFLFEGGFGNVLHTGDCRLTPDCLQNLPMKYILKKGKESDCHLDYLFLDCTFSKSHIKMPNNESAIQQVISCIWKHPNAPVVYLSCDLLGREQILIEVSRTFGNKIFVDKIEEPDFFQSLLLVAPEILSDDSSSRFQVLGLSRLNEKASEELAGARAKFQSEPLFIRPSVQWYVNQPSGTKSHGRKPYLAEAERDEFGVWHVCHSMHSSRQELEWALQFLRPKWVISTTPPSRAMDLDYVKNNCYKTNITSDDPLWKLFKGSKAKSTTIPLSSDILKNKDAPTSVVDVATSSETDQLQPETSSEDQCELKLDLSPPSRTQSITLFGRARLGFEDLVKISFEENDIVNKELDKLSAQHDMTIEQASSVSLGGELACSKNVSSSLDTVADQAYSSMVEKVVERDFSNQSFSVNRGVDSSIHYSKNLIISDSSIRTTGIVGRDTANMFESGNHKMGSSSISSSASSISEPDPDKLEERFEVLWDMPCVGTSSIFNPSMRKLYRSMNVPVPRPLPSLTELMENYKRAKYMA